MDTPERVKKSKNIFGDFSTRTLCIDKTNQWKIRQKFGTEYQKVNGLKASGERQGAGQESWSHCNTCGLLGFRSF